jgi:DinB superfamily
MTASIMQTFDDVWDRLLRRIRDLRDDEYFWEPVVGCWSLRPTDDGRWLLDGDGGGGPAPDPVPVTTIVWRLGHLAGTLGGFARMRFGDGQRLTAAELDVPPHAYELSPFLAGYYRSWKDGLLTLPAAEWTQPLGTSFGPYAEANTVDLALHVLDEVVHHAAEVGVLRDLWSAGLR